MTIRSLVTFLLFALVAACGAPQAQTGAASGADAAAVWQVDEDANLAYPTCPNCGAVVDRGSATCADCGARVHVEPKTIVCPECNGSKKCVHCSAAHACLACKGTHVCAICEGTGKWKGETCPECQGSKTCQVCATAQAQDCCDRCNGDHVCANCGGTGQITLK